MINALLAQARHTLAPYSPTPLVDAQRLLCATLGCNLSALYTHPEKRLSPQEQDAFNAQLARRLSGEPIAYILGKQPFWTFELNVNPHTLIPRPETELLVEKALEILPKEQPLLLLDVGTGSGCIALALASERPHWHILGIDYSHQALHTAADNAKKLALKNVNFRQSHWLDTLPTSPLFHAIISNPPYIASDDTHRQQGDLRFEPNTALDGGKTGLTAINHIIDQARPHLHPGGWLMLEHGYDQAPPVQTHLKQLGYTHITQHQDLNQQDRVSIAQWQPNN